MGVVAEGGQGEEKYRQIKSRGDAQCKGMRWHRLLHESGREMSEVMRACMRACVRTAARRESALGAWRRSKEKINTVGQKSIQ